jgi:hypothetical protein
MRPDTTVNTLGAERMAIDRLSKKTKCGYITLGKFVQITPQQHAAFRGSSDAATKPQSVRRNPRRSGSGATCRSKSHPAGRSIGPKLSVPNTMWDGTSSAWGNSVLHADRIF